MPFCVHCGTDIPEESQFCTACGKSRAAAPGPQAPQARKRRIPVLTLILLLALLGVVASIAIPALLAQRSRARQASAYQELLARQANPPARPGNPPAVDWGFLTAKDRGDLALALEPRKDPAAPARLDNELRKKILDRLTSSELEALRCALAPLPHTKKWKTDKRNAALTADRACDFVLARKVLDRLDELQFCRALRALFFLTYATSLNVESDYADAAVGDMDRIKTITDRLEAASGEAQAQPAPLDEADASRIVLAGIRKTNDLISSLSVTALTPGTFTAPGVAEALVSIHSGDFISAEGLDHVYLLRWTAGAWTYVEEVAQGKVQEVRPHGESGLLDAFIGETGMQNGQTYTHGQWLSLAGFPATPAVRAAATGRP